MTGAWDCIDGICIPGCIGPGISGECIDDGCIDDGCVNGIPIAGCIDGDCIDGGCIDGSGDGEGVIGCMCGAGWGSDSAAVVGGASAFALRELTCGGGDRFMTCGWLAISCARCAAGAWTGDGEPVGRLGGGAG